MRTSPIILFFIVVGCTGSDPMVGKSCDDEHPCPDDLICRYEADALAGICIEPCEETSDCIGGDVCRDGVCATLCEVPETCEGGLGCRDGVCQSCTSDSQCPGLYLCDLTTNRCADSCSNDTDCQTGGYCDSAAGECFDLLFEGQSCERDTMCEGGYCVDGVCCENACGGTCMGCAATLTAASNGACAPIPSGEDPHGECGGFGCNGEGGCIDGAENGVACGLAEQCASRWCVDGVCCESACDGTCEACAEAKTGATDGTCAAIPYLDDPDDECASFGCSDSRSCNLPRSWGTATLIENDNAGSASRPQVAMDPSGNAIAVWSQSDGTRTNIWANRYVPSTGWGTETLIETDNAGDTYSPRLAMDQSGNAIAVWQQHDGTRRNIWANRYVPSVGWGTATLIETDNETNINPQVAIDQSGNAIAVWYQEEGNNVWANRYVPGAGWGTATLIENDEGTGARGPKVAVDPSGNAVTVWGEEDGGKIWTNRFVPGTGWGTATLIETQGAVPWGVVMDAGGNAIAIYATLNSIWAHRYVAGAGWGAAILIKGHESGAGAPQVAIGPSGNAVAVWYHHDGTRYNIWASSFE